jgi:hypothetical protein
VLKKTVTYEDFNGEEVTEDLYFHLSKAELIEMEMSHRGGLSEALKRIVAAEDGKAIIAEFKNIILGAYGKRSDDGRRFVKNQTLREEFESSEAYSTLFMELVTDTDSAINFINGIVPAKMAQEVGQLAEKKEATVTPLPPRIEVGPIQLTKADIDEMPAEELKEITPRIASGEIKIVE